MRTIRLLLIAIGAIVLSGRVPRAAAVDAPAPVSYANPDAWLCLPSRADDACGRADLATTIIQPDGATRVEPYRADPDAPIDCFYVYPTVSLDPGGNATMTAEPQETGVVAQQFARFGSVCRTYAPLYRQVTLTALRDALKGQPVPTDRAMAYDDVRRAWDYYLQHYNHGRGVVLIGHSQGSLVLAQLVKQEIDGKPAQQRLLSVILAGYRLQVPRGKDVGGDFNSIPLCRTADQIGCAINFASFRATSPPPPDEKIFAISSGPGLEAACTNPAALAGGSGPLHAYLASGTQAVIADGVEPGAWTNPPKPITTPFVAVPGMLSAQCVDDGTYDYLAITIHPSTGGARTDTLTGDVSVGGHILKDWGLHLIDMNLTMGNLIDIVRRQGQTYRARSH